MAPIAAAQCDEMLKMKMPQVCSPSPGKFAWELLDILDGSMDEPAVLPYRWLDAPSDGSMAGSMFHRSPEAAKQQVPQAKGRKKRSIAEAGSAQMPEAKKPKTAKEETQKLSELELTSQRRKELNAMTLPRIKEMVSRRGLGLGTKEKMVESILVAETRSRANVRQHKCNANDVLVHKREELTRKTNKELKELLKAYALQASGKKPEFVERLLATWQEQGEIEKAMAGIAFRARKAELESMDKVALYELCLKKGVDALSKDTVLDRLLVHESADIWQELAEARPQMKGVNPLSILWSR